LDEVGPGVAGLARGLFQPLPSPQWGRYRGNIARQNLRSQEPESDSDAGKRARMGEAGARMPAHTFRARPYESRGAPLPLRFSMSRGLWRAFVRLGAPGPRGG